MKEMTEADITQKWLVRQLKQGRNEFAVRTLGGIRECLGYAWEAAYKAIQKKPIRAYAAGAIFRQLNKLARKWGEREEQEEVLTDELAEGLYAREGEPGAEVELHFADTRDAETLARAVSEVVLTQRDQRIIQRIMDGEGVVEASEAEGSTYYATRQLLDRIGEKM